MDSLNELKEEIVRLRDVKEMTYEDIADTINNRLGYKKYSRQAIFGLYKRSKEKEELKNKVGLQIFDVINVYVRTKTIKGAQAGIQLLGYELTNYAIQNIIDTYKDIADTMENELVELVYDCICTGDSPDEIRERLRYKGIYCTTKVIDNIIYDVYERKIKEAISNLVYESENYTGFKKKVGKRLLERFNISESLTVTLNRERKNLADEVV